MRETPFIIIGLALLGLAPVAAYPDVLCVPVVTPLFGEAQLPWSLKDQVNLAKYRVGDFLPGSYTSLLEENGFKPELQLDFDPVKQRGVLHISARSRVGVPNLIVNLEFWVGRSEESVVVEHLRLQNPLVPRTDLHPNQTAKGLPIGVALHFKKQLYQFLAAGGFKNLENLTSQDYITGTLYRRLLGGVQTEEGRAFSAYTARLYELSSKVFPDALKSKDLDQFTERLGNGFRSSVSFPFAISYRPITLDELKNGVARLEGASILKDPDSGNPIAIGMKDTVIFLYREGEGYRPLFWNEIHARHPDWVRVDVPLGNAQPKP